ncbi:zinc-binding alcohol dehydrogenase family protein [Novosphingobium sp. BL-8A]|uniref:quinone oxidoreductase family protein n=1 Tax=Novosphingobium sp. BL-8A TaxID=3127639 RepID=UPI0037562E6E
MVLIEVELVSIEAVDLVKLALYRRAKVETPNGAIGCQASGTVVATGPAVTRFQPGDHVVGYHAHGSHAELFAAPEASTWHLPTGIDPAIAAAAPFTLAATHGTLFARGGLTAGETILINHATSSLGIVASQLAVEAGASVIGIARDSARRDLIADLGLHHVLSAERDDVFARCLDLTGEEGVDFVFDVSAGERFADLARLVKPNGRYAAVSAAEGLPRPAYGMDGANSPDITPFGIMPEAPMDTPATHALVSAMLERVARGEIHLPIEHEFALREADEAYEFILTGQPFGHVVLRP